MSYIGQRPVVGRYIKLDQISSGFNGSNTGFSMTAGSQAVFPGTARNLLLSLGGVIQEPDTDFTISGSTLTFTTPPVANTTFFGVIYGDMQATGTPSDGTVLPASIASSGNFSFPEVTVTGDVNIADSIIHSGDTDTKIRFGAANEFSVETAGVERFEITPTEVTFNDTGADVDFRIEGDTDANLFKVDASTDRVGIGTSSPSQLLHLKQTGANALLLVERDSGGIGFLEAQASKFVLGSSNNNAVHIVQNSGDALTINTSKNVGIGTISPSQKLQVTSGNILLDGTDQYIYLSNDADQWLSANAASNYLRIGTANEERVRIDSSGRTLIGTTSILHSQSNKLYVAGTDSSTSISLNRYADSIYAPYIHFRKSRSGTVGGNTIVQDDDLLGRIYFEGNDGSSPVSAAYIEAHVDGTPGNQDMPGRLEFLTTADGSPTPVERMRIDSSGDVGIGMTASGVRLDVYSSSASDIARFSGPNSAGITIRNDTANELQLHTAPNDALIFGTNGENERMRIDSSGKVGIGTTTPDQTLHVHKGSAGSIDSTSTSVITLENSDNAILQFLCPNNKSAQLRFGDPEDNGAGYIDYDHSQNRLSIGTNGPEKMRIDSSGRLLVGTSTASSAGNSQYSLFEVNGNTSGATGPGHLSIKRGTASASLSNGDTIGRLIFSGLDGGDFAFIQASVDADTTNDFPGRLMFYTCADGATSATERMSIKNDGKISIGGTAKAKKLTIVDDNASQSGANDGTITDALVMLYGGKRTVVNSETTIDETILHLKGQITDSGANSTGEHTTNKIVFSGRRATGAQCWIEHTVDWNYSNQTAGGNLIFKTAPISSNGGTAPVQRMVIHNDGTIVVNDTGDVGGGEGGVRLKNPDVGTCRFGASNAGQITYIQFINGSSIAGSISGSSSSTSFNTSSDYRLKENESLISDGIARLKQLKPYRFNWKSDSSTIVDGFFAHEVSSIVPESITGTKDAVAVEDDVEKGLADAVGDPIYQSIDQAKLVPLLTAALQEEISKREALEARVAALEAA